MISLDIFILDCSVNRFSEIFSVTFACGGLIRAITYVNTRFSTYRRKKIDHRRFNVTYTTKDSWSLLIVAASVRRIVERISPAFAISSINVIRQVAQSDLNDGRKRGSLYSSMDIFFYGASPSTLSSSSLLSYSP